MDIYHGWCNLKDGVRDTEFAAAFNRYMSALQRDGKIASFRLTRRKLGLGASALGDFHFMIEFTDLAQLDAAFLTAAARREPVESLHFGVNSLVKDVTFALYRDFPDEVRETGQEKF